MAQRRAASRQENLCAARENRRGDAGRRRRGAATAGMALCPRTLAAEECEESWRLRDVSGRHRQLLASSLYLNITPSHCARRRTSLAPGATHLALSCAARMRLAASSRRVFATLFCCNGWPRAATLFSLLAHHETRGDVARITMAHFIKGGINRVAKTTLAWLRHDGAFRGQPAA